MKKITFELPKQRQVEINGQVFDIRKTDRDILKKAAEYQSKAAAIMSAAKSATPETEAAGEAKSLDAAVNAGTKPPQITGFDEVVEFVESIIASIDEILGKGAVGKIMKGAPIDIASAIRLMTLISEAVVEEYNQDMADKYE